MPVSEAEADTANVDVSTLDKDVAATIEAAPEPNDEWLSKQQAKAESEKSTDENATQNDNLAKDKLGNTFDPNVHATDADGNAKYNKDGTLRRKRGRQSGQSIGSPNTSNLYREAATATTQATFIMGQAIGGDEFAPIVNVEQGIDEPQMMINAWVEYYKSKGITQVPPWLGLAIAYTAYVGPRLTKPTVKSRLAGLYANLKTRYQNWQAKKRKGKRSGESSE